MKDSELSLNNIKKIIAPITYKNEEYYMISGSVRLDEKSDDRYGNSWIDTYIINLAIDEDYNLCKVSDEDRKYTIETIKYRGNLEDYKSKSYKMSTSLYSSSDLSNVYVTTDFNLPPAIIIKEFLYTNIVDYDKFLTFSTKLNLTIMKLLEDKRIKLANPSADIYFSRK